MFKKTTAAMFSLVAGALMVATPANAQSADWQRSVARLVAAKQTYPRAAQMRGDEGTAKVKVNVTADGSIGNVELVAPSGSSVLDREALALPAKVGKFPPPPRSEEHTSELQSLMRLSYAVFRLKNKNHKPT